VERSVEAFFLAGEATTAVVGSPEVAAAWSAPSALAGYQVGELAAHTLVATARLELVLREEEPSGATVVDLPTFYGTNRVDDPSTTDGGYHPLIRAVAAESAEHGPEAVAGELRSTLDRLRPVLAGADPGRLVSVLNVRNGATPLEEYLRTRVVELVVHGDDLAASVGLPSDVAPVAAGVVLDACLELARARSGDLAVLRAFVRRERADAEVLRVL
jgi:uncharacterized protein (TIGR03083 family)